MRTKLVNISDLKAAQYNPRQMSDHDMASLVNGIREFGMVEPIVVNKNNTVIGGHQRLLAAKQLSIAKVPVFYVDLSKKKEKILNLALNRIHGDWDLEKLSVVLEELKMDDGDDLRLTGFSDVELEKLNPNLDKLLSNFDREDEPTDFYRINLTFFNIEDCNSIRAFFNDKVKKFQIPNMTDKALLFGKAMLKFVNSK